MTDSHVLARKFRPQTFDQVVGQDAITRTLSNAVKNDRVHHAYIFTGARGVGKTTTARIFAKALNCARGASAEPCGVCDSCQDIAASRCMDVIEIDAASNTGVDSVRDVIINSIAIAPARDRNKIFIIDEVHMLSAPAFNALLKTVEEPPPRVVFILATTSLEKVPETILSRCQIFEFRTITLKNIVQELRRIASVEEVKISDAALLAIARAGEGSMRDAESALDQVISFAVGTTVTDEDVSAALGLADTQTLNTTLQAIADQDSGQLIRIVDEVVARGFDLRNFCREMMVHIRAILVVKIAGFDSELVQLPESEADTLKRLGEFFSEQDLLRFFSILTKTEQDIRNSSQPRFQLEIGLVKLAQARRLYLLEEALGRIEALESRIRATGGESDSTPARAAAAETIRSSTRVPATGRPARDREASLNARPAETQGLGASPPAASDVSPPPNAVVSATNTSGPRSDASSATTPKIDDVREIAAKKPPRTTASEPNSNRTDAPVDKIKAALEAKRKMMIVTALDKGTVSIDGNYLRVEYAPENSSCKAEVESREKRIAIEDACEQVLGSRLTLRASIAGQSETKTRNKEKPKSAAEEDPKLRALVDKFHGEVIEVIKPR